MNQFTSNIEDIQGKAGTKKLRLRLFGFIFGLILVLLIGFLFGLIVSDLKVAQPDSQNVVAKTKQELLNIFSGNREIDVDLFSDVWNILHSEHINKNKINDQDLFYGAISGMVSAMDDPYTIFLDPQLTEDFNQELDGTFYGIGAEIDKRDDFLVVIAPLPDTPADRAGLKAGDKILAIDQKETFEMSVDEAISLIRGDKGTAVVLTIFSEGDSSTRDVSIVRDKINVPSVVYTLEDNIAVIRLTHFNSDTSQDFSRIAQKVIAQNPKGIILDMRNNPGGYLDTAVSIASYWVPVGQVVVRESFSDKSNDHDYQAVRQVDLSQFKTIVLINQGSASASEIVAGALQDYDLAEIVGQTSFGKGSVQQLVPLGDGSSVKVTVAKWLTPKGRTIEDEGIVPDIEADLTIDDYNNDIDPQLDKAKELINQP